MTVFCEYAFKFATYENVFMFFMFTSMQLYMFGGVYMFEFSGNRLFYFIQKYLCNSFQPLLSFFLSFSNILE